MWRVVFLCLLQILRYFLMEYVVTPLVENLVMVPVSKFLLGGDGEDGGGGGGYGRRREEDGSGGGGEGGVGE